MVGIVHQCMGHQFWGERIRRHSELSIHGLLSRTLLLGVVCSGAWHWWCYGSLLLAFL